MHEMNNDAHQRSAVARLKLPVSFLRHVFELELERLERTGVDTDSRSCRSVRLNLQLQG
jgi:hypothetical protein